MVDDPKSPLPQPDELETVSVACPHCAAHIAKPIAVTTLKGDALHVDVTMRCTDCKQT